MSAGMQQTSYSCLNLLYHYHRQVQDCMYAIHVKLIWQWITVLFFQRNQLQLFWNASCQWNELLQWRAQVPSRPAAAARRPALKKIGKRLSHGLSRGTEAIANQFGWEAPGGMWQRRVHTRPVRQSPCKNRWEILVWESRLLARELPPQATSADERISGSRLPTLQGRRSGPLGSSRLGRGCVRVRPAASAHDSKGAQGLARTCVRVECTGCRR